MDQNVKSLETLQEAFRGSLDPEVVELIFIDSDYVVNDALEKLLSISKTVSSSDNCSPDSENKSSRQNSAAIKEDFSQWNDWRTTDRKTSKVDKKAHKASSFRDNKSNSLALLPKFDTYSSGDATETQISVADSSEQNGNSTKDSSYHSSNSTLELHSEESGIEVTDQPLSNELPPWPDHSQGYLHPIKSFSGQPCNAHQRFLIPHNFQGQRFFHYVPPNVRTYHPRSALHAPSIRYQSSGFYPGQAFSKYRTRSEGLFLSHAKVLVLLRGLPGSGKTTLAQKLKHDGVILSTDDFFMINERYQFEQNDLAKAHEWNQKRAKDSMQRGVSPVIIDNTNMQAWEMRPYVSMAKRFGYEVMIKEPDTPWKWNTKELLKRNRHNVTLFSIQNMKERYEKDLTVEAILATSWEKLEKDNPKIEMCNSNKDETRKHNSECIKPTRVPQEMETLRSHGSRSPIQDIDFSLSELSHAGQSLDINKSYSNVNTDVNFDETVLPKPQRTPKRREKASKSLERMQNSEDIKEKPNKFLDSKEAKSVSGRPVLYISEEEESVDDNVQKSIGGILNSENTLSLKKEMENTGSSLPLNPLITTDESMTVETNTKEFCSENSFAKEITKIESENNTDEETHEKAEEYLAKTNDWDELFKNAGTHKEKSLENFKNDLSESELSGFQFLNTCFPDMDIQLLVDVLAKNQGDVTKAVESILRHEDNSSKVESRKHETSNFNSPGKNSLKTSSCQKTTAYTALDQGLKPLRNYHFQESRAQKPLPSLKSANYLPRVGHDPGHFQMTLEPAVAIQLLELFGPIDTVSLEGDFSSNDLIVQVDSEFAKLLYNQWQKTIQSNMKEKLSYTEKQPQVSRTVNKKDSSQRSEDSKATDLRQIMDEQMAVEQNRQDQKESKENIAAVLKLQKLYAMFPGVDPLALKELFEANRYELQPTISMVETSCNFQAKPSVFQEKQGNWNSRSHDDGLGELKTEFQELQDPDYEDFRAEANTHYKLRDECFRKAAFAFSKKQGQLAKFYASQGHMHTEKIRQANRRAAARILEHKNSNGDQNSLDLHGLHVDEALLALEEKLIFSDWPVDRPRYLSVITGRGIHSKQGKAKIKPAVLEYLQRNNYRFEELPGLLRVFINR